MKLLILFFRKIEGVHAKVSKKDFRSALSEIDIVIKIAGSRVRELNLLKTLILIELNRAPEAYNLTNAMVRSFVTICTVIIVFIFMTMCISKISFD